MSKEFDKWYEANPHGGDLTFMREVFEAGVASTGLYKPRLCACGEEIFSNSKEVCVLCVREAKALLEDG